MPNSFEGYPNSGESGEETPREVNRERGEKAAEAKSRAEAEAEEREILEELERLKAERKKLMEELGEEEEEEEEQPVAPEETGEKPSRAETVDKAAKKPGLKKFLIGAAAVALAGVIAAGIYVGTNRDKNNSDADPGTATAVTTETTAEAENSLVGELENGTSYDYTHYADRHIEFDDEGNVSAYVTNKEAWNAYDYDYSADFGSREAAEKGIMEVASRAPEALASYAYNIFTDAEKEELGIAGMTMVEIDDYMSNNEHGGEMQARLLDKLDQVLHDEHTNFNFYYEDDTEDTNYIYWVDDNGDGNMTPVELHLGYDTRDRNGAPQVDIYRSFLAGQDKNGDYYESRKMLDLNLTCGYQPNYEKDAVPAGVPQVPANPDNPNTGSEGTGSEGTGSEGTGSEGTGSEGTGSEGTGSEGTGSEGTGAEGTGTEGTGTEGTGSEGTGSEGTGSEGTGLTPKSETQEIEYAGDRVDIQDLDESVTPATNLTDDQANFEAIEAQRAADQQAAEEAERVRAEQAEAERQAAAEAEARRQAEADAAAQASAEQAAREAEARRQADEAAARAEADAAAAQQAAAEAERQAAAEQAAREAAQAEADAAAAANAAEAESNANASAGERADMFNNGDF